MKKIFLTGGTGFVGSHLINKLVAAGHAVYALRRPGSEPRVKLLRDPIWIEGNLMTDHSNVLKNCDLLIHLASASTNPPYAPLSDCIFWNVLAPIKLAELALDCGVNEFIVVGSVFEYGDLNEASDGFRLTSPLNPKLSYPTSKAAASIAFSGLCRERLAKMKILRLFHVFGEGELESRFWPSLKRAAEAGLNFEMSAGEQVRDFMNVSEVCDEILRQLDFQAVVMGEPVLKHIASNSPQTLLSFAKFWWKKFGATGVLKVGEVPYRPNESMRIVSGD